MSKDYESNLEQYGLDRDGIQIIVIKRYDDDGGVYTATVVTWPRIDDENYSDTSRTIGFLKDDVQFRSDLVANGFVRQGFNAPMPLLVEEFDGEKSEVTFQHYVTHNILPIEWHNCMDELPMSDRVHVYVKK